jgi:hypothetical protein
VVADSLAPLKKEGGAPVMPVEREQDRGAGRRRADVRTIMPTALAAPEDWRDAGGRRLQGEASALV